MAKDIFCKHPKNITAEFGLQFVLYVLATSIFEWTKWINSLHNNCVAHAIFIGLRNVI